VLLGNSTAALLIPFHPGRANELPAADQSRVVVTRDPALRKGGRTPDSDRLAKLLDRALTAYFDRDRPLEAWKLIAGQEQTVGLKVNCLAGFGMSSSVDITDIICERLQEVGVKKNRIIIWDRMNRDLERAGFRIEQNPNRIRGYCNNYAGVELIRSVDG